MRRNLVLLACVLCGCAQAALDCSKPSTVVYKDMHDGDFKKATISDTAQDGSQIVIQPFNNTQTWKVVSQWDTTHCNASIDFRVPGKPNPPPCALSAYAYLAGGGVAAPAMSVLFFVDPTKKLGPGVLNTWVVTP